MSGAKHTPGPWALKVALYKDDVGIFAPGTARMSDGSATDGLLIAECYADIRSADEGNAGEALANARVIAIAPALLSLVERYASECAECGGRGTFLSHREDPGGHSVLECWECADIREVISAAQVTP